MVQILTAWMFLVLWCCGDLDTVTFLVECDIDVSNRDRHDDSALNVVVKLCNLIIVKYFMECSVNINVKNKTINSYRSPAAQQLQMICKLN